MATLKRKRRILDGRALARALAEAGSARSRRLGVLKAALKQGQAEVRARLKAGESGAAVVAANSYLIDGLLRAVLEREAAAAGIAKTEPPLALVAVGGFGRAELAPASDIDLLFLFEREPDVALRRLVEAVLHLLWDLGLAVGHAARTLEDCLDQARADMTIRTSLLESRLLWGRAALFKSLRARFFDEIATGSEVEFIAAKLTERDARHRKIGDSRYVLEPNVKEGKGGLRDLHTLYWIGKYIYRVERFAELVERGVLSGAEWRRFSRAEDFFWRVRAHLHVLAGRAEERLSFDVQPEVARRMGYAGASVNETVARFMKDYFLAAKNVGDLTRILCAQLEAEHHRAAPGQSTGAGLGTANADGFVVEQGRLSVAADDVFEHRPARILRLFHLAQELGIDIHPKALRLIHQNRRLVGRELRADAEANRLFVELLTSPLDPETALRRMNEAGVLGRFLPEFGRVIAQAQHDMYHVYTVDEHSIRAVGALADIERGTLVDELPLASEVTHKVISRRALYIAVLLHDLAKGSGGDHSEEGARVALRVGRRLGFSAEETETVSWLVLHHLRFSDTAFKRDINDPKTVSDFIAEVQSLERLRLLLVLTAADIRATGPGRWNGWKGSLLRELYARAEEVLSGGHEATAKAARVARAKEALRERLADWPDAEIAAHFARLHPPYWLSGETTRQERHARLLRAAGADEAAFGFDAQVDDFRDVTEVTLYAPDHAGLFAEVAGAMAASGASIVDAQILTTEDGMALDSFWVQDAGGGAPAEPARLERLRNNLAQAFAGTLDVDEALRRRRRSARGRARALFAVEPRVLIDNRASGHHTLVEVNGTDRVGLLFDVTRALSRLGLSIVTAHVATFGARAVDAFYVKDRFGLKVTHTAKIDALRARLLAVLANPDEGSETASNSDGAVAG